MSVPSPCFPELQNLPSLPNLQRTSICPLTLLHLLNICLPLPLQNVTAPQARSLNTFQHQPDPAVCIKRTEPIRKEHCAEFTADGQCIRWELISECPAAFTLVNDMCEYRDVLDCRSPSPTPSSAYDMPSLTPAPSKLVEPSMTPAPSKATEPSRDPEPSKFTAPSQDPQRPSETPSPSPITYMTATLSIDFGNSSTSNASTVLQDPTVIDRIKEAIAAMLGVDVSKVVIDGVEWVSNGVSTKFYLTARRLQAIKDGLYINYKVMDTLSISSDEYAAKVDLLAAPLSAAVGYDVSVSSTPLTMVPPTKLEEAKSTTPSAVFIIIGSILSIGLVGAAVVYNRRRRGTGKSTNMILRNPYNDKHDITKVTILGGENHKMSAPNKLFNYSGRSMVSHNPMQVRRPLV